MLTVEQGIESQALLLGDRISTKLCAYSLRHINTFLEASLSESDFWNLYLKIHGDMIH